MEAYDSKEQSSFWQFSDQLRLQSATTSAFSALSLGDSIWSDTAFSGRPAADRRNADLPSAPDLAASWKPAFASQKLAFGTTSTHAASRYNTNTNPNPNTPQKGSFYSGNIYSHNNDGEIFKNYFNKTIGKPAGIGHCSGKKNNNHNDAGGKKKKNANSNNNSCGNGTAADKRFKTLPASEALPRNEAIGGYVFVCNNDTMEENLRRQLFGLPSRYRDSVRAITPGLPLFLYNYSNHQLHGIFEAASFGGTNIDPSAWEDKKCPGKSRFPAQVKVVTRKVCDPLEEDAFRPILHHYDGPKFRLELSVPEALALLDIFADSYAF